MLLDPAPQENAYSVGHALDFIAHKWGCSKRSLIRYGVHLRLRAYGMHTNTGYCPKRRQRLVRNFRVPESAVLNECLLGLPKSAEPQTAAEEKMCRAEIREFVYGKDAATPAVRMPPDLFSRERA